MDDTLLTDGLFSLFWIIYIITIIGVILIVLSENRNPLKSISWILVLMFFPIGGLLFYIFLGRDFRKQRMISKKSFKKIDQYSFDFDVNPKNVNLDSNSAMIATLLKKVGNSKLYAGNHIDNYHQSR